MGFGYELMENVHFRIMKRRGEFGTDDRFRNGTRPRANRVRQKLHIFCYLSSPNPKTMKTTTKPVSFHTTTSPNTKLKTNNHKQICTSKFLSPKKTNCFDSPRRNGKKWRIILLLDKPRASCKSVHALPEQCCLWRDGRLLLACSAGWRDAVAVLAISWRFSNFVLIAN